MSRVEMNSHSLIDLFRSYFEHIVIELLIYYSSWSTSNHHSFSDFLTHIMMMTLLMTTFTSTQKFSFRMKSIWITLIVINSTSMWFEFSIHKRFRDSRITFCENSYDWNSHSESKFISIHCLLIHELLSKSIAILAWP